MDKEKAEDLINRYLNGEASSTEKRQVEDWYNSLAKKSDYDFSQTDFSTIGKEIKKKLPATSHKLNTFYKIAAAAVFIIISSLTIRWFAQNDNHLYHHNIKPGTQTATLVLANGQRVALTDSLTGTIQEINGLRIINNKNHQLSIEVTDDPSSAKMQASLHSLITGVGQQYQLMLPDRTKIWLNSGSELKFPSSFKNLKMRKVLLQGEAYFEVAKDAGQPFVVQLTDAQEIEVLGTQFSIKTSTSQQQAVQTFLLEGRVKVKAHDDQKVLLPGQLANSSAQGIAIQKGDAEEILDWKNGDFVFHSKRLEEVMDKLAAWYNIKVVYEADVNHQSTYSGQISRSANISEILKSLEDTMNIRFTINNNQITITNK